MKIYVLRITVDFQHKDVVVFDKPYALSEMDLSDVIGEFSVNEFFWDGDNEWIAIGSYYGKILNLDFNQVEVISYQ